MINVLLEGHIVDLAGHLLGIQHNLEQRVELEQGGLELVVPAHSGDVQHIDEVT